jgi:hypothetical protein
MTYFVRAMIRFQQEYEDDRSRMFQILLGSRRREVGGHSCLCCQ